MKLLFIFTYLIGVIFAYAYAKYYRNLSNQNTWVDVLLSFIFACMSWVGLLLLKAIKTHTVTGKRGYDNPPKFL